MELRLSRHASRVDRRVRRALRQVLLSGAAQRFGPAGEAILFSSARIDHVDNTIEPALARGAWVISDRFADFTRAYQGALGKLDRRFIMELERIAVGNAQPDLTIFLDIPPEAGLLRVSKRRGGEPADRSRQGHGVSLHLAQRIRRDCQSGTRALHRRHALAPEDVVAAAIWREVETRLLGEAPQKPRRTRRRQKAEERA